MFNESKEPKGKIFAQSLVIVGYSFCFLFQSEMAIHFSFLWSFPVFSFLYCLKEKEKKLTLAANLPIWKKSCITAASGFLWTSLGMVQNTDTSFAAERCFCIIGLLISTAFPCFVLRTDVRLRTTFIAYFVTYIIMFTGTLVYHI